MREREPMTQTLNTTDAARSFLKLVERVSKHETRVVVEENGKTVAALVSPADLEQLRRLDTYREDPWRVIDEIHTRNRDKDPEEAKRDVTKALAEVRAADRAPIAQHFRHTFCDQYSRASAITSSASSYARSRQGSSLRSTRCAGLRALTTPARSSKVALM